MRGLGSDTGLKGLTQNANKTLDVPDNVPAPAPTPDYRTISSCLKAIESGLLSVDAPQAQLLYCSILVPHPPYRSNETYMKQVAALDIHPPQWVPKASVHPFDKWTSMTKGMYNIAPPLLSLFLSRALSLSLSLILTLPLLSLFSPSSLHP